MSEKAAKKATVERVAELAMRLGGKHLADYGSARSRHDFTQRQLMACLILRAYLKTTYRGVLELLYGDEPHHIVEGLFKSFARAVDAARQHDPRIAGVLPSTKGKL